MDTTGLVERGLISKRFILALMIISNYLYTGQGEALVGAVMGFYFAEKIRGMNENR